MIRWGFPQWLAVGQPGLHINTDHQIYLILNMLLLIAEKILTLNMLLLIAENQTIFWGAPSAFDKS